MRLNSLQDLFEHELKDLYSAETQIAEALPKMMEAAHSQELKDAFNEHLQVTKEQIGRLERIGTMLKTNLKGETCEAARGLIKEGESLIKEGADPDVLDAALIGSAQRIEHYEMAGYGCARNYAKRLGHDEAAKLLQATLDEEKEADAKLNKIAESKINERAMNA
jgi:ferritin-like metal-binding protein YciE